MASKDKAPPAAPEPLPRVGGSFILNKETGAWEPSSVEPEPTPLADSTDGTDS